MYVNSTAPNTGAPVLVSRILLFVFNVFYIEVAHEIQQRQR